MTERSTDFLAELAWRGLLYQRTAEAWLEFLGSQRP